MENEIPKMLKAMESFLDVHYDEIITDKEGNYQIYSKKALVGKIKDFEIIIYPNDHGNPDHFHLISKQRSLNIRLNLYTLEPLQGEHISRKDLKRIKFIMKFPSDLHQRILLKYQDLHPSCKIEAYRK
jgi:hypothetical protein